MIGLLCGTWMWVLFRPAHLLPMNKDFLLSMCLIGCGLAGVRFLVYISDGYLPPVSLGARIATGHLIIPGFDKILLAPLCIVATSLLSPIVLPALGLDIPGCFSVWIALVATALFGLGPSLNDWRLTGAHSIVTNFTTQRNRRSVRGS